MVAGDGPLGPELEAMAAELHSPLRLLGHRDDVADLLAIADVAVLSSDWEARPLVAQEALRNGAALVATDVGGVAGLVGDAAVLVPPGDAAALGTAIRALLDDPVRRARNIRLGLERALTWPTVEDMVDELEQVYLDLRGRS
jgi:glycosyltransferase involved in cell wall biosynthesis